ncbi:hypothetical protein Tsubulata_043269 [Turnera subulata]|uniref:Protein FAR1-RELATED SEQUENCE n=1 Tax=Turnera subulata TaxID=218843 RepID=A0A9Q0F5A9_9ROSI|nr:hypothetical protein Tsubulata_043269 [Turnera subulata]
MSEVVVDKVISDSLQIYTLRNHHVVTFNTKDIYVSCSCRKFETMGYLCSHALRVLHTDLVFSFIPGQYVLKRWTKAAKQGLGFESHSHESDTTLVTPAVARLSSLMRRSFAVMNLASQDENRTNEVHAILNDLEQKWNMAENEVDEDSTNIQTDSITNSNGLILDPKTRWPKGKKNIRLKPSYEKKKVSKRKVSHQLDTMTVGPTSLVEFQAQHSLRDEVVLSQ